jgi:ribosomal protein L13E
MKANLIETNSQLYMRRMVREINRMLRTGQAVYATHYPFPLRVTRAYESKATCKVVVDDRQGRTFSKDTTAFYDGNGSEICASRQP